MSIATILTCLVSLSGADVHLGALFGIQGSTLVGDDAERTNPPPNDHRIGSVGTLSTGNIGIAMDFEQPNASVRLGAFYSAKGWTRQIGDVTWDQHLNYLAVPLELHLLALSPTASVRPYLAAGFYWAGLVAAEIRSADYPELDEKNTSDWKPSAAGVILGVGAQGKAAGKYRIGAQIRLHRDLTVNFKDSRDTYNQSIGLDIFAGI